MTATTTLPFSDRRIELSGVNLAASTALGTTETRRGGAPLRSTVFSFAVCDTHTTWLQSLSVSTKSLFMWIALASSNPNREWSVNTHLYPIVRAWNTASWPITENAWCACTTVIFSRSRIARSSLKLPKMSGNVDPLYTGTRNA